MEMGHIFPLVEYVLFSLVGLCYHSLQVVPIIL